MRVAGCSEWLICLGAEEISCIDVKKIRKGLGAVHSDKSAANICKPRQWRSQQSCLAYIALDDRLPVIDSTMRMQCHCDKRRILFGAIEAASNTDSDSSFAATETMR